MGDLHGCYDLFTRALKDIGFAPDKDRLISVGDIIDRGPDSEKCLELLDLPWFHMVRGNHEQMMIDAITTKNSKDWHVTYGRWSQSMSAERKRFWATRFAALPTSYTLDCGDFQVGICHAEPPGDTWANIHHPDAEAQMLWGRRTLKYLPKTNVDGINITIHGHTPLERAAWVGNRYFMDTGAWDTGILTLRNVRNIWDEYNASSKLFKLQ